MPIPETQLETWSHQGAGIGSRDTYATVKGALEAGDAKYAQKSFNVFLQGSYGNDTNIWAESDVDVVIRLDSIFYYDTSALTPVELADFNAGFTLGTYPYSEYKGHVIAALEKKFGADVKPANRAIKIKANGARRSADVVVAADFRRYYSKLSPLLQLSGFTSPPIGPLLYERGICFLNSEGQRIVNYPKQHSANCTAKHQATNGWFKPMVRIVKNMRSNLVASGAIQPGSAPSYFIEGLLFNVPDDKFGVSYSDTFVAAINWIFQADRKLFKCANKEQELIRDGFPTCWPCANCDTFLNELVKLWNDWS
jgi:hypothetical protein